jgi:hypothetical protein
MCLENANITRKICEEDLEMTFATSPCNITLYPICIDDDDNCTTVTAANKAACFARVGGTLITREVADDWCETFGGTSSSSSGGGTTPSSSSGGGTTTSSSSNAPVTIIGYCDYGYPNTSGGGCFPITSMDECDLDYGILKARCGTRTDITYCEYSTGCWDIPNTLDDRVDCNEWGDVVTECPVSKYGETFYCLRTVEEVTYCVRISASGTYKNARGCFSESEYNGVVHEDFCIASGATIRNN